ncbi:hypothetical protein O181_056963 [Austropuccinia psidii MF-1]|uniref:Integrase catalytic domain-containing protein n=1 Tax=Austropuccinia psidii MF-1 TaxID=1389203 RepID=A0A9Q3EAG8_9BASI|nr:hypothetical protein [Austropuccinia psidii MF-1]
MGHTGENEAYRRIKARFLWEGMKKAVKKWVQFFLAFQRRSQILQREQGNSTETSKIFPETVGLVKLTEKEVSEWFTSEWICRYGSPKEVNFDGGPEFRKEFQYAVKKAGSRTRVTTPYYPDSQGMVERGYKQLKDALVNMCRENGEKWKKYLPLVALADRSLTKRTTGFSPY